jgi:class 3 adenylate cyclase/tetratricopeptide (TPR) repeat protein
MDDVAVWLKKLGLDQYSRVFSERGINLDKLRSLREIDLKEIGIPDDHRKRMLAFAVEQKSFKALASVKKNESKGSVDQGTRLREAERRFLTILFVDIVDSTGLARRLDPEDLAQLLNAFHEICGHILKRFGGCVAKDLGDGLGAYFGWPESHEQDAERAVMAALEMIQAVKAIPNPSGDQIKLHLGIATGAVVVGNVIRRTNTLVQEVYGELPSLAARLQSSSPPDAILISSETHRLVRNKFVCAHAGRKRLKGFHEFTELYRVIGPRGLSLNFDARRAGGLTPLIGRAAEFELIRGLWENAAVGRGQAALLTGEPGIGKSRLCDELHSSLPEHRGFFFQCSPLHKDSPLYPVMRSIARIAGLSDEDAPELKMEKLTALFKSSDAHDSEAIALLAAHLGASKEGGTGQEIPIAARLKRRRMMLNALIINFFVALARDNPVLIVFEDLHWMDPTTAEFLDMLLEQIRGHSILLICTFRSEFSPRWKDVELVVLDRLTKTETAEFIHKFASATRLTEDLVLKLVERSDGNPLYIEELTAAVLSGQRSAGATSSSRGTDLSRSQIPSTLQESLLSRIDRASPQAKELTQVCAVIGRRFSRRQLLAITEIDEQKLDATLAELIQERLLQSVGQPPDMEYFFKHALIQATAYSMILREKRQRLHSKCAEALEIQFPSICQQEPGVLGLHYESAGNVQAAVPYILAAAKSAIDRSALQEATTYLHRGLELLDKLPSSETRDAEELKFRSTLGRVCIFGKGWADQSVKHEYERALFLAKKLGNRRDEIPLEWALTTYHLLRGEIHKSIAGGRRVLGLAELADDDDSRHVAHSALSIYEFYGGNFVGAIDHKNQALRFHRDKSSEELRKTFGTDRRLQALRGAALSHWCVGDHELAVGMDEEQRVRAIDRPFDYTYALTISCIFHSLGRNARMMRSFAESAITIARDQGFGFLESNAANFRAIALALENPSEANLRGSHDAFEEYRQAGNRMGISSMFGIVAELYDEIDLPDRGLSYVDRALDYVKRSGEQFAHSDLYRVKGILLASLHRVEEAKKCLSKALQIARKQQAKTWELAAAISLAEILNSQGEFEKSALLLRPLYHEFEASKFLKEHLVRAHTLLEECQSGKLRSSITHLRQV